MVILDTNIIIDHLRQREKGDTILMKVARAVGKEEMGISVISVQELYEGESTRDKRKEELLLATIAPLAIFPYTYEVSQYAGEIARDQKDAIEFADAAIAATAIIHNAQLLTLNKKDFIAIKELEFFQLSERLTESNG